VLRAAGETETTQKNIQDWLQLDEGYPGFQLQTEEEIVSVISFIYFHQHCLHYCHDLGCVTLEGVWIGE
jgi:hypothetical protein